MSLRPRRIDWTSYAAAAGSGLLVSLAFPLVVPFLAIRELDPRGWLEAVAYYLAAAAAYGAAQGSAAEPPKPEAAPTAEPGGRVKKAR